MAGRVEREEWLGEALQKWKPFSPQTDAATHAHILFSAHLPAPARATNSSPHRCKNRFTAERVTAESLFLWMQHPEMRWMGDTPIISPRTVTACYSPIEIRTLHYLLSHWYPGYRGPTVVQRTTELPSIVTQRYRVWEVGCRPAVCHGRHILSLPSFPIHYNWQQLAWKQSPYKLVPTIILPANDQGCSK